MVIGRSQIFTDEEKITDENILSVLRDAWNDFLTVSSECNMLLDYEAGYQPLTREKTYRSDINVECVDNVANEITEFKCGFDWGNVITLIQRGEKDSGEKNGNEAEAIALLNESYANQEISRKQQELARFVEICGVGYTYIDINTDWTEGESLFTIDVLDPRFAFVVRSSRYIDHRIVLGVTSRTDDKGNTYFTCFTKDKRYEILNLAEVTNGVKKDEWSHIARSGEKNPIGVVPMVEWVRSPDRMGCFERQISELDNLNILVSDFTNDVDQNTQAVWHCNDIDFPEDEDGNVIKPASGDWLQSYSHRDGKQPFIKPLAVEYDYSGMLNNIIARRSLILQKANVPQRNDNSGGSTGVAMSDATGWSAAENSACKGQNIKESCKLQEVKIALMAIKANKLTPYDYPLLKLRYTDVQANIKRQKTYELTVKVNALATLLNVGVNGSHAFKTVNLFDDANQVWIDSQELVEKIQDKNASKDEPQSEEVVEINSADDPANQITNSPSIDGMSKEDSEVDSNSEE